MWYKVVYGTDGDVHVKGMRLRSVGGFNGREVFRNNSTCEEYVSTYGTLDENNDFHAFCTATECCGERCFNASSPACRYNRKYTKDAGHYIWIED